MNKFLKITGNAIFIGLFTYVAYVFAWAASGQAPMFNILTGGFIASWFAVCFVVVALYELFK